MKQTALKKIIDIIIILVFIGMIAIPLIFFNQDSSKILVTENRGTTQRPKVFLEDGNTLNIHFISQFDKYVNDNIGFKEEAVILRLVEMYKLFNKIDVPNYMMGKDEHLFYTNNGLMIETFQERNLLNEDQMQRFYAALKNTNDFFESTGAKFYFMTIPDKEQIYPEYYPESIYRYGNSTKVEKLADYVQSKNDIVMFHIKNALLEAKENDLLFYKNYDPTHWNMNGAFIGYQEIMKYLKKDFPELKAFSKEEFNINTEKSKGTIQHLSSIESLCKTHNFEDTLYFYELKEGYKAVDTQGVIPEGVELNNNVIYYHFINESNTDAPKLLIMGDSYIYSFLLPLLAESFSEVYFTGVTEAERIAALQTRIQADVVLYEFVERAFDYNSYVKELEKFENMKSIDFPYENLKKEAVRPEFYVDIPSQEIQGQLKFDSSSNIGVIKGWALDNYSQDVWGELYARVGDKYYEAERFERPDIEQSSGKSEYLMCGFSFHIPIADLLKSDKIEFILISNDKTYQYESVKFSVSVE